MGYALEVERAAEPELIVLTLGGALCRTTAGELERALREVVGDRRGLTLDISKLEFIDAGGFRVLERAQAECMGAGQGFLVLADRAQLRLAQFLTGIEPLNMRLVREQAG